MPNSEEMRLTDLEIQHSHLGRTVDELNGVVAEQAKEIALLTRRMRALMERAAQESVDGGEAAPLSDQVPPHW